jgi:hypothetical protein
MDQKKSIIQRINAVMADVSYVKKDAQVSGGGGGSYSAVSHDQVVSMVRSAMVNHGIVCYPEQVSGEMLIMRGGEVKMHLYSGQYRVHFAGLDGDEIVAVVHAHANDNGDKAPGKALTYAVKSAMLKVFNLETGVNDESREEARGNNRSAMDDSDAFLDYCAATLPSLQKAAAQGTKALQHCFAKLPAAPHKQAFWKQHGAALKESAAKVAP